MLPWAKAEVRAMNCPICGEELPERKVLGVDAHSPLGLVLPNLLWPIGCLILVPIVDLLLGDPPTAYLGATVTLATCIAVVLSARVLMRRDLFVHRSHLRATADRKLKEIEGIIEKHRKDEPPEPKDEE
jgi:hypothetical protein